MSDTGITPMRMPHLKSCWPRGIPVFHVPPLLRKHPPMRKHRGECLGMPHVTIGVFVPGREIYFPPSRRTGERTGVEGKCCFINRVPRYLGVFSGKGGGVDLRLRWKKLPTSTNIPIWTSTLFFFRGQEVRLSYPQGRRPGCWGAF